MPDKDTEVTAAKKRSGASLTIISHSSYSFVVKERIDTLLVKRELVESRAKAQARILAGEVVVDEHRIEKPGTLVSLDAIIRFKGKSQPFVSRGGLKLQEAIESWPCPIDNQICLDVGASTGGFTDVLLKKGAQLVYAVDVGYGQLHWSLRTNNKVKNFERTHIGKVPPNFFDPPPTVAAIDVSFISLAKVLPHVIQLMAAKAHIFMLIKPQFEVGRQHVEKGGIVRNADARTQAVERILQMAESLNCEIIGIKESPVTGADGNVEYICSLAISRSPLEN